ncbi:hypothetical protein [Paenibacillus sp. NFR01]|uniref:hypothetical protein n=1 Tax=Paenibacillus sp. NFR01 TaxID=1566279 RepID=UPI001587321D|nr:hypothetical protein [Paenibacillus sp. NFR01]
MDLELNYGDFQRQLSGIAGTASGLVGKAFKGLGGIIAGAFAVKGLVDFGREAIGLASDLQEVQNVVDVTFGAMAGQVDAWSKDLIESFGLSELSAKRYASTMGAMLKSSGLTGTAIRDMSLNLTQLAADISSFYNLNGDEAFYKVFSGLTGETEPLKQLGINMSVVNMQAYAMSQGIHKSWTEMTQAEQTMLRYGYLMKVTADAQGDFARTSNSWANQTRVLTEQWKIFQGTMGAGFINILAPVVRALNGIIGRLQVAAEYFRAFTELIFGSAAGTSSAASSTAAAIGGMGSVASDTAGSMGDLGDATADAGKDTKKAGKDIKNGLAGFDQLNILTKATADSAADAAAGAAGLAAGLGGGLGDFSLGTATIDTDPIKAQVATFVNDIKAMFAGVGGISLDPLRKSLDGLWDALKPFGKMAGQGLQWFLKNVLFPLSKWTVEKALPAFLDVLAGALRVLDSVIQAFMPAAGWLWDNFLLPLASWTGDTVVNGLLGLAGALNGLSSWINGNQGTLTQGVLIIGAFFAAFKFAEFIAWVGPFVSGLGEMITSSALFTGIVDALTGAISALLSPIGAIIALAGVLIYAFIDLYKESATFREEIQQLGVTWKDALQPLADFVGGVLTDSWTDILQPAITFFLQTLLPQLLSLFKQLWQQVLVPLANFIGTVLKPVFSILADVLSMLWKYVILPLADAVGGVLAEAWKAFYDIMTITVLPIIRKVIDIVTELWKQVLLPLIDMLWSALKPAFETVFDGIKTVIEGLKTTLTGILRFITGVFTGDWGKAWEGVKMVFKGVFDALYGIVKTPLDLIIDAINTMIDGLNSLKIDMPDWMGGKSFGLNISHIPHLAKGGLAYGPTLAMVGDNRGAAADPEVVAPLSKLQGMLGSDNTEVVTVLLQILEALQRQGQTVLQVGETTLAQVVIKSLNNYHRQAGQTLLEL